MLSVSFTIFSASTGIGSYWKFSEHLLELKNESKSGEGMELISL